MKQERIAFIIHSLVVGGAEKFFISVVNNFQEKGHAPFVVLLSDDNPLLPELHSGVEYKIEERKSKYDINVGKRVKEMLLERKIEKIFCVNTFSFFMIRIAFLFDKRFRFFLSLHSTIPKSVKDFVQNLIYFRVAGRKDKVIYICEAQKKYIQRKYFFSHADNMIIYNGINTAYFSQCNAASGSRDLLRKQYNVPPDAKMIVKVARLAIEKGHQYAIQALQVLHTKYKMKAYLFFVGSGSSEYKDILQKMVTYCGVKDYVFFVDHQKDVRPYHCMADMFTLTSYSIETFSLAALEAMSSGIPCSLTDIGGAAEMINENSGALCQAKDPDSMAASWEKVLQKNYNGGWLHDYVENNFSLPKMLAQYEQVLLGQ